MGSVSPYADLALKIRMAAVESRDECEGKILLCSACSGVVEGTSFGDKVRDARKARGLSQEQLAKLLGVQHPVISKIETGKAKASSSMYVKLTRLLNLI